MRTLILISILTALAPAAVFAADHRGGGGRTFSSGSVTRSGHSDFASRGGYSRGSDRGWNGSHDGGGSRGGDWDRGRSHGGFDFSLGFGFYSGYGGYYDDYGYRSYRSPVYYEPRVVYSAPAVVEDAPVVYCDPPPVVYRYYSAPTVTYTRYDSGYCYPSSSSVHVETHYYYSR